MSCQTVQPLQNVVVGRGGEEVVSWALKAPGWMEKGEEEPSLPGCR